MDYKQFPLLKKHNILGIEMEAAAMYAIANEYRVHALAINMVSDEIHLKNYDPHTEQFANPRDKFTFIHMDKEKRQF